MQEIYIADKTYDRNDFTKDPLSKGEYEGCLFNGCNFSGMDLSGFTFIDCQFNGCNVSLAQLNKTALQDIRFTDCKMLGLRFDTCSHSDFPFPSPIANSITPRFTGSRSKKRFSKKYSYRKPILLIVT